MSQDRYLKAIFAFPFFQCTDVTSKYIWNSRITVHLLFFCFKCSLSLFIILTSKSLISFYSIRWSHNQEFWPRLWCLCVFRICSNTQRKMYKSQNHFTPTLTFSTSFLQLPTTSPSSPCRSFPLTSKTFSRVLVSIVPRSSGTLHSSQANS